MEENNLYFLLYPCNKPYIIKYFFFFMNGYIKTGTEEKNGIKWIYYDRRYGPEKPAYYLISPHLWRDNFCSKFKSKF